MKKKATIIYCIALYVFNIFFANAQDTHYWTQQYGTKSSLLGGAVIGGVRDNSGIYYNPGTMGFIQNGELSVQATAYQMDRVLFKNGGGDDINLKSSTLQTMPLIISGLYKLKNKPKHTLGYCLLTKDQFNIKANGRVEDFRNLINDSISAGDEEYISQFHLRSSVYEFLSGWAYGYKLSDKLSIGIGNYGSYRSYHVDRYRVSRLVSSDTSNNGDIATFNRNNSMELKNVRTVIKLGVALDLKKWKFGLTLTSPSINIWGKANYISDLTSANVDYNGDGKADSFVANSREDGLKTQYKTPFIAGFGFEYNNDEKTIIAFSCEYFDKVDKYTVMQPSSKPFYRPSTYQLPTADQSLAISDEKKSVFNFAIGIEQKLNEKYSGSIGFRTNNSYSTKEKLETINLTFTNWNIYHLTLGVTKRREKSNLSVALNFGYGSKNNAYQWVNLTNATLENRLIGEPQQASLKYTSFAVVIGYTRFGK